MNEISPRQAGRPGHFPGAGPVTRAMVHARTRELAVLAGRTPLQASQADYEQARQELTGESDPDRQDAVLDAIPQSPRRAGDPAGQNAVRQLVETAP